MTNVDAIQKAIEAHTGWKARLRTAVSGGVFEVPAATVKLDNQCEFGRWLYGTEIASADKQTEHYRTAKRLHAQFHLEAAKVVEWATSGQKQKAEEALGLEGGYTKISRELTQEMIKWRESLR